MAEFICKEPKLSKRGEIKKWFIRYFIKYEGDEKFKPCTEYGITQVCMSWLNSLPVLKMIVTIGDLVS